MRAMSPSGTGNAPWNGVAILGKGVAPVEIRRGLPGDPQDEHSRYIEASVADVVVGCLYLPNGNPQPGPKFDYKLAWFERLITHAHSLYASKKPVVLAGDFNVVPTDVDIYDPKSWKKDALLQPETREAYRRLLAPRLDRLHSGHYTPMSAFTPFWDYFRNHWQRNSGLRIDHVLLNEDSGAAPHRCECRHLGSRPAARQRPCARVGRTCPTARRTPASPLRSARD